MSAPVLLAVPASREEWLAARRAGIGASEIAVVMGISPWDSPFGLHWKKVNGWETEANDDMRNGLFLEPAIAEWWSGTHDPNENLMVVDGALYAHPERPWQLATPDRIVHLVCGDCDGAGYLKELAWPEACTSCLSTGLGSLPLAVLELKYAPHSWDGWGDAGTDDIPPYYRAQVLWQCDVMGVDEWYLAALGPGGFREYRGRVDETDLAAMRAAGEEFMARLDAGDPPPLDGHHATLSALRRLHPTVEDFDVEVAVDLAEGYRLAREDRDRAVTAVDEYEAQIRQAIGNGRRAMCNGRLVASRSVYDQSGDTAELSAIDADWPTVNRLNPGRSKTYI